MIIIINIVFLQCLCVSVCVWQLRIKVQAPPSFFFFLSYLFMFRCIHQLPKHSYRHVFRPIRLYTTDHGEPILTELVHGRKRIYTSLPTIAKTKSATASKSRIASPVTSSPLSWEWIHPSEEKEGNYYATSKQKNNGLGVVSAVKQNLTEMFLPVG